MQFLMERLEAGEFSTEWESVLQQIYAGNPTLRSEAILEGARQLAQYLARPSPQSGASSAPESAVGLRAAGRPAAESTPSSESGSVDDLQAAGGNAEGTAPPPPREPARPENAKPQKLGWDPPRKPIHTEAERQEVLLHLRRELAEEQRDVALEYKLYRKLNFDFPFYRRFSLCAPQDKYWGTAIYQELSLGQEIDRTLKLTVALKSRSDVAVLSSPAGQGSSASSRGKGDGSRRGGARG